MEQELRIGCVADDFTGAGDAASLLVENGVPTVLISGVPGHGMKLPEDAAAAVVALKSRTQPVKEAVHDSLEAFQWLRDRGAATLYFKYCSTFDSTPKGNIGPVTDAVMERYGFDRTVICPAMLPNGRAVRDGVLYVDGVPLAETHMRHHPLTPMWESEVKKLMEAQGSYTCLNIGYGDLEDASRVRALTEGYGAQHRRFYICPDYFIPEHGDLIVDLFGRLPFLTGGSGLLGDLGRCTGINIPPAKPRQWAGSGRRLLLAGSCSKATRLQIARYLATGKRALLVSPRGLLSGLQTWESLWGFYQEHRGEDVLFYSAGSAGVMEEPSGTEKGAAVLEQTFARLARAAVEDGLSNLVVGGGETSGAVTKALGCHMFRIGQSVAPGVPVMYPVENSDLRLVLKSGNFGGEEFFCNALRD